MLNRRHIRIKVLQALYSYITHAGETDVKETEQQLRKNISRLYELYLYIILFTKELGHLAEIYDDEVKSHVIPSAQDINANSRFYESIIIKVLSESKSLENELNRMKITWDSENKDMLRKVFLDLKNNEIYKEYVRSDKSEDIYDLEILSYIVRHYSENFALTEQHFEEQFINWFDDYKIAVQMAIKTYRHIITYPESDDFLIPLTQDEKQSDEFAIKLLNEVITHGNYFLELINTKVDKWEPSRIPVVDSLILKMGLAEFLHFHDIPVRVTINEYVELAKNYSTPNSKKFINGVLDNLLSDLDKTGRIKKMGLGTLEE
jgi:transcription antitermination protein NusB